MIISISSDNAYACIANLTEPVNLSIWLTNGKKSWMDKNTNELSSVRNGNANHTDNYLKTFLSSNLYSFKHTVLDSIWYQTCFDICENKTCLYLIQEIQNHF